MKKFIIILSAIMVAAVSISAASQRNVYLWKSDGTITVSDPEDIDSLSFSGAHLFNITNTSYGENRTTHSFDASINVAFNFADKTLGGTIEVGVCYSADNVEPTIDDTTITLGSESDYTYTAYLRKLSPSTTYYFRGYVKLLNEVFYGDVASVTTVDAYVIDGHNFMDARSAERTAGLNQTSAASMTTMPAVTSLGRRHRPRKNTPEQPMHTVSILQQNITLPTE